MDIKLGNICIKDYTEERYITINDFTKEGLAVVQNSKELYGFINLKGEEQIPCEFTFAHNFSEGLACVEKDNKYYFIDTKGEIKIACPEEYIYVKPFRNGRAWVKNNKDKKGYIDKNGIEIIPCQYKFADEFSDDLALVTIENKKYPIDANGNILEHLIGNYDFGTNPFKNGIAPISLYYDIYDKRSSYPGYIDKSGKIYSKKEQVEQLDKFYRAEKPDFLQYPQGEAKEYINYCSTISFLNQTIELKATTETELAEKKRILLQDIKCAMESFIKSELDEKRTR